jgi:hypothetical protein
MDVQFVASIAPIVCEKARGFGSSSSSSLEPEWNRPMTFTGR